jgi:dTDP-4-dehydrorhamnose reductase
MIRSGLAIETGEPIVNNKCYDVLLVGGSGQLGRAVSALAWPKGVKLHRPTRAELDLSSDASISMYLKTRRYDLVINSAAFTDVEKSETEKDYAFQINAKAPGLLAQLTRFARTPLIHISTDYVFDGRSSSAYLEDSLTNPINAYGASKLEGEIAVLTAHPNAVVIRTSWLMSALPGNFLTTMLSLAQSQSSVRVVDDQFGSPTSAYDFASTLRIIGLRLIDDPTSVAGVFHFANSGIVSRASLAKEIFAFSEALGGPSAKIERIPSTAFTSSARRPDFSALSTQKIQNKFEISPPSWQRSVEKIVKTIRRESPDT